MENMMERVIRSKQIAEGVSRIDKILLQPEITFNPDCKMPQRYDIGLKMCVFLIIMMKIMQ